MNTSVQTSCQQGSQNALFLILLKAIQSQSYDSKQMQLVTGTGYRYRYSLLQVTGTVTGTGYSWLQVQVTYELEKAVSPIKYGSARTSDVKATRTAAPLDKIV